MILSGKLGAAVPPWDKLASHKYLAFGILLSFDHWAWFSIRPDFKTE